MTSQLKAVIEIEGLKTTEAFMQEVGRRSYETEILMEQMAEYLEIAARSRLAHAPWKPLATSTVTRKASQGEDIRVMRDEWRPIRGTPTRKGDALYMALDGGPGSFKASTRTTATYGIHSNGPLFYARMVQNLPGAKRKLLAIPAEYAVGMADHVATYVLGVNRRVGAVQFANKTARIVPMGG